MLPYVYPNPPGFVVVIAGYGVYGPYTPIGFRSSIFEIQQCSTLRHRRAWLT